MVGIGIIASMSTVYEGYRIRAGSIINTSDCVSSLRQITNVLLSAQLAAADSTFQVFNEVTSAATLHMHTLLQANMLKSQETCAAVNDDGALMDTADEARMLGSRTSVVPLWLPPFQSKSSVTVEFVRSILHENIATILEKPPTTNVSLISNSTSTAAHSFIANGPDFLSLAYARVMWRRLVQGKRFTEAVDSLILLGVSGASLLLGCMLGIFLCIRTSRVVENRDQVLKHLKHCPLPSLKAARKFAQSELLAFKELRVGPEEDTSFGGFDADSYADDMTAESSKKIAQLQASGELCWVQQQPFVGILSGYSAQHGLWQLQVQGSVSLYGPSLDHGNLAVNYCLQSHINAVCSANVCSAHV